MVGPAYINAYLLEETLANTPRVIVDSKIINELGFSSATLFIDKINDVDNGGLEFINWGSSKLYSWEHPNKMSATLINKDVLLFIDYLCPIVEKNNGELLKVIRNIESSMYKDTKIYEKFRWVSDYLKSKTMRCGSDGIYINSEDMIRLSNL